MNILIRNSVEDKKSAEVFAHALYDFMDEAAKDLELANPKMDIMVSTTRNGTRFIAKLADGLMGVLLIERTMDGDSIENDLFKIYDGYQGKGLAKKLFKHQNAASKTLGIKKYNVTANITVGGYAWLRAGYTPNSYLDVVKMVMFQNPVAYDKKYNAEMRDIIKSGSEKDAKAFVKKQVAARRKDLFLNTHWKGSAKPSDLDDWVYGTKKPKKVKTPKGPPNPANLATRHAVFLTQRAGKIHNELISIMDEAERQILNRVGNTDWQEERNTSVLKDVRAIKRAAWAKWRGELGEDLKDFADYETNYANEFLDSLVPVQTTYAAPEAILTAIEIEPLTVDHNGGQDTLQGFMDDWEQKDIQAVTRVIRGGIASSATRREMIAMVKGISPATTRSARTIVRTSLNHISSTARDKVYRANEDIVEGYEVVATLDRRTTGKCRGLDGHVFRWNDHPLLRPPFHPGCRTTTIPKLISEFDIFDSGATRASMDGPVPSDQTYYGWLKEEPFEVQKEIMGVNRAKLLSDGGLTAEQFRNLSVDQMFEPLTLEEMARRDKEFGYGAFKRAGVEPRI